MREDLYREELEAWEAERNEELQWQPTAEELIILAEATS